MTSIQLNKYIDRESLVSSLSFNIDTRPCFPSISITLFGEILGKINL